MTLKQSPPVVEQFSLQSWRENFLRVILRGTLVLALFALIPSIIIQNDRITTLINIGVYTMLAAVTFAPLPYRLRAVIFILLPFMLGVVGLFDTGMWGDARPFFFATVVFTAMLLSPRAAIGAAAISMGITALAAWLIITGQVTMLTTDLPVRTGWDWFNSNMAVVMLDAIAIIGINLLQREFERAQERAQESLLALERERFLLEKRVEERTAEIASKTIQLEAASSVARKIAEIRDLQSLLDNVTRSIADQFGFYHVGLFLLDDKKQFAILQAASSEGGRKMLQLGHRLGVGQTGIVGYVTGRGRPRVALDTGADAVFFDNPHLPLTHSEMALPLIVRGNVIGALDIQSEKGNAFSDDDVEIMQTVADQLAIAIENARLFSETETVISQFEVLTALQTRDAWAGYLRRRAPGYQYTTLGVRPLSAAVPAAGENSHELRVPITLRGQEIGAIRLRRKETAPAWSPRERELAAEIAAQVALALDTSRLLEETQKSAARDQMIAGVSNRIRQTLDMETVLQTAANELRNAFGLMEAEVRLDPAKPAEETRAKPVGAPHDSPHRGPLLS